MGGVDCMVNYGFLLLLCEHVSNVILFFDLMVPFDIISTPS
jgi:hypothetical protein